MKDPLLLLYLSMPIMAQALEHFGCCIHDSAQAFGGQQVVVTPEGYTIPFHVRNGLFYMDMDPPCDGELASLPMMFITSDSP